MRLHAVGGLCNRLRAILSTLAAGPVEVVWEADEYVSGARFLDVFEPVAGLDFVEAGGGWDVEAWAPSADAPEGWLSMYSALRPVESVAQRIATTAPAREYLAIHVRRTDHVPNVSTHGGCIRTLEEYIEWSKQWPMLPLYLATDNRVTQEKVRTMRHSVYWGAALPASPELQALEDHHRNGTLADAVVDLYMCARAAHFQGSVGSSFTDTIDVLRGLRGVSGR